ncbi:MAG: SDR family oxidoreductase [Deltaproteobacteria bacterium]|nr:SDR family oxidoreductase [Deltaproteobacteria bacterium]
MGALDGKIAVVTGAGSGIGRSIARVLAQAGAHIVIPDINHDAARETAREIQELGRQTLAIEADVTRKDHVNLLFDMTLNEFGKVDILINNAGTTHPTQSILDLDLHYVDKIFDLDYKGLYLCCRRAGKEMVKQKSGCILNISSIAGLTPLPLVMYGPMKSAVNMLTKILAREWAQFNIRVNAIAPGYVLTPLIRDMIEKGQRDPKALIERIPMKAMSDPDDIAEAALFLVSSGARHITGTILPVEGGWLTDGGWSAYK